MFCLPIFATTSHKAVYYIRFFITVQYSDASVLCRLFSYSGKWRKL